MPQRYKTHGRGTPGVDTKPPMCPIAVQLHLFFGLQRKKLTKLSYYKGNTAKIRNPLSTSNEHN
jgi:hypothetical protein